jgi:hypothetical protein
MERDDESVFEPVSPPVSEPVLHPSFEPGSTKRAGRGEAARRAPVPRVLPNPDS